MNERGKSDSPIVPGKPPNKAERSAEEVVEGRGLANGSLRERNASRTPSRTDALSALERVRHAARSDGRQRFTALLHHVYDVGRLRSAYLATRKDAAAGVDGVTWEEYGRELESNLRDLSDRVKRGAYRAKPVRRVYIPKTDGRQRPLGVPTWASYRTSYEVASDFFRWFWILVDAATRVRSSSFFSVSMVIQ